MSDLFTKVEAMRSQAAAKAEENRRRMPQVAAWVDGIKAVFDQATVTYASEGGITLGKPMTGGIKMSETRIGQWHKGKK
jgi:hypothetical protein